MTITIEAPQDLNISSTQIGLIVGIIAAGGLAGWVFDRVTGQIISTLVLDVLVPQISKSVADIPQETAHRPSLVGMLILLKAIILLLTYEIPGLGILGLAYAAGKRIGMF